MSAIRPVESRRTARLGWLIATVAILALTAFLLRGWLRGGLPTSARREVITELAIVWMFRAEMLQGQLLTEWNPTWFSGFPWLRFLSYPIYYAVAALSAWGHVPLEATMVLFYFIVMAGSGLMMFGYLRHILQDWRAALVGAVIYEAFPYHSHVGVETWIHAAFWVLFPLALWLIELARTEGLKRIGYLSLAGVALGCFPIISSEYAILAGPFVVLYFLLREWSDVRAGRHRFLEGLGGAVLVGVVALGVAAFFVLPSVLEVRYVGIHAKHGAATTFTDRLLRDYSVTPSLVWYAFVRRLHLPVRNEDLPGLARSFWSVTWYPGVFAPILAMLSWRGIARRFEARAAAVGLALSLVLITGPTCSFNLFSRLPVFGRLSPFRGVLLVVAFIAVLAAFGVQWLLERRGKGRWRQWLILGGVLAGVLIDFSPAAAAYQTTPAYFTPDEQAAYGWIASRAAPGRLWEVSTLPRDQYLRTYSLSLVERPRYVGYYDNGAALHTWEQVAWTDLRTQLRLHCVRYVLLHTGEAESDRLRDPLREAGYQMAFISGPVQVWEQEAIKGYTEFYSQAALDGTQDFRYPFQALPQFVWRNIALVTPASAAPRDLARTEKGRYDYLLVDGPVTHEGQVAERTWPDIGAEVVTADRAATLVEAPVTEATVWAERPAYGGVNLTVRAPTRGVLTLAESWYPHWRVRVDGRPQPVLRANWALLGVWLEPGEHHVRFVYQRPWYVLLSYSITLATWAALALWWIWYIIRLLNQPHAPSWENLRDERIEMALETSEKRSIGD